MAAALAPAAALALFACASAPRLEPELEHAPTEADYYEIVSYQIPPGVVLEVGAIAVLPDGRPMVSTRRGEVYILDGAYDGDTPRLTKYAPVAWISC